MTAVFPQITSPPQAQAEVVVNENFQALEHMGVYAKDASTTSGLTWGYLGGRWGGFAVTAGTLALTASATNYVVIEIATGTTSVSTSSTHWNDAANYARAYKIVAGSASVTSSEDHRAGPGGVHGGGGGGTSTTNAVGLSFTSSTTTTDSDPGTGILRWNNATQASATQLFIDNADADSTSLATLWASLVAGTFLKITKATDANVWQLWKVNSAPVNGTGYYKFSVTLQAQEGSNIGDALPIFLDVDASSAVLSSAGKHAVPIVASAMRPSVSGGCANLAAIASAANQPDIVTLDFDPTTEEYAQFAVPMPKSWNEGTITAKFLWSHASTTTNFGAVWGIQAVAVSDGDAIATSFGTAQTVADTGGTTNTLYATAETSAITVGGSPAAEDTVFFRVYRKAADASDTMTIDARLHGVVIFITTDAETDA